MSIYIGDKITAARNFNLPSIVNDLVKLISKLLKAIADWHCKSLMKGAVFCNLECCIL